MATITELERQRRRGVNASVVGTSRMEGLELDSTVLTLMRRFEEGELDRQQLSAAMDSHASELLARVVQGRRPAATDAA